VNPGRLGDRWATTDGPSLCDQNLARLDDRDDGVADFELSRSAEACVMVDAISWPPM
jgi:hypothetical protein